MTLEFDRIPVNAQQGNPLRVNLEDGAIIGTEPIREVFNLVAVNVPANTPKVWSVNVDFSPLNIFLFEQALGNKNQIIFTLKNALTVNYLTLVLTRNDFVKLGNLSYLKIPDLVIAKNDYIELQADFSLANIMVVCKRMKILDVIYPKN